MQKSRYLPRDRSDFVDRWAAAEMREISEEPLDLPGARELFLLPGNTNFEALLASARHFAEEVEPHKALCIARALPATIVDNLEALIPKFEVAIDRKSNGRATKISGTAGVEAHAKTLLATLQELRAILRVTPALLESWQHAARIESLPRSVGRLSPNHSIVQIHAESVSEGRQQVFFPVGTV